MTAPAGSVSSHSLATGRTGGKFLVQLPDGQVRGFEIVEDDTLDASKGRISAESPMGNALLGGKPGDEVVVKAPKGPYTIRVVAVERDDGPTVGRGETIDSK